MARTIKGTPKKDFAFGIKLDIDHYEKLIYIASKFPGEKKAAAIDYCIEQGYKAVTQPKLDL